MKQSDCDLLLFIGETAGGVPIIGTSSDPAQRQLLLESVARDFRRERGPDVQISDRDVAIWVDYLTLYTYQKLTHILKSPEVYRYEEVPPRLSRQVRRYNERHNIAPPRTTIYLTDKPREQVTYLKDREDLVQLTSWLVRGHWRRIDPRSLGVNRAGERVVTGHTWVKPHTRGDTDLSLPPKTYVIK